MQIIYVYQLPLCTTRPGILGLGMVHSHQIIWAPVKILYMLLLWLSLLGEPYRFPGLCGTQYIRDPTWSQYPFLNRLGNGSMIEELFCWFQVLWQHFMLLSFYINLHPCSFHFVFIFLHFPFILLSFVISLHFSFIFLSCSFQYIPMCIHVLSLSFHLHACSFHFAFMSFYLLSKVVEMVLSLGQGTACNKWLSLSYR